MTHAQIPDPERGHDRTEDQQDALFARFPVPRRAHRAPTRDAPVHPVGAAHLVHGLPRRLRAVYGTAAGDQSSEADGPRALLRAHQTERYLSRARRAHERT